MSALDGNSSAVLVENASADGESEARTARPGGKAGLEDMWQIRLLYPGSGVAHFNLGSPGPAVEAANGKPSTARHEAKGIERQIQ